VTRSSSVLLAAILLLTAGCHRAQVAEPLTASLSGSDEDSQLSFWHTLADRSVTSNDEAWHGMLLFLDEKDDATDYAGRVAALKSRGILPATFDRPADEGVTRGNLAVALANALSIKGGVIMRTFGVSPRYATRELQYLSIYPESSSHQTFRGNEFIFIIGRAEDYLRQVNPKTPAKQLSDEPAGKEGGA